MKIIAKISILIILAIIVYFSWVIYSSHQYTINTVLLNEQRAEYPVKFSSLSERQIKILLQVEDPNFFNHSGVDFFTPGAGITTISQSLVKQLYFANFKPGIAKLKQTIIAYFVLDPLMSKEQQLTSFMNKIYLGKGTVGFEQASKTYFNKRFSEISEDEYISLVAMIIAPNTFNIEKHPERNKQRVERIKLLIGGKYIPQGLCDLYYGKIDKDITSELPPFSYFESYYQ